MRVVRWSRAEVARRSVAIAIDDLDDAAIVVLDDATADDDEAMAWCRRAPCVVVARTPEGEPPSSVADVALVGTDIEARLDAIVDRAIRNPSAARVLVDVLRVVPGLDVPTGIVVESLAYSMLLGGPEFARWRSEHAAPSPRSFENDPVRARRDGAHLAVTLTRPENRNALSAAMRDALVESLRIAEADPTIESVEIDAEGPVFSSGGDLAEFGSAHDLARAHEVRTLRSVGAAIDRLGNVTVAARGRCVGAGVELSAFARRVHADPGTTFRLPEVAMGLIPGAGGTVSLSRRIGPQRTAELALSGREIDVDEALEIGLVDEVVVAGEARAPTEDAV